MSLAQIFLVSSLLPLVALGVHLRVIIAANSFHNPYRRGHGALWFCGSVTALATAVTLSDEPSGRAFDILSVLGPVAMASASVIGWLDTARQCGLIGDRGEPRAALKRGAAADGRPADPRPCRSTRHQEPWDG